jgi:YD repeat-containing protein
LRTKYFKIDYRYLEEQGRISPNITSISDPIFGDQYMTYDYLNRLTSAAQDAPSDLETFKLETGEAWTGYGIKNFSYADNGNILQRTRPDPAGSSTDQMVYSYDPNKIHAVTNIQVEGTPVFTAQYDDNGSMKNKLSNIDGTFREHFYKYDSDGRMTAVLDADSLRISDSFYHLQGGRLFEGQLDQFGNVQGSISINPYFELKISSGDPVYMVKHILAGGRRVASIYEQVTDYSKQGLGCQSIGTKISVASHREIVLAMFIILFVPLVVLLLISTRFFTSPQFMAHPFRNAFILMLLVVFLIEFSPVVTIDFSSINPLHKKPCWIDNRALAM